MTADIIIFAASVAGTLIDPLNWLGYLIAGICIRQRLFSIAAGMVWPLILTIMINLVFGIQPHSTLWLMSTITGAGVATLLVHFIASKARSRKTESQEA